VFFAVADPLNLEVELLLFDTTSTYFERDTEEEGEHAFRRYSHSEDHRADLPSFRDLKSTLELRPVFHRLEPRIRAHVLLCWLALLLIRVAERRTGLTWRRIAIELGRVHAVTLTGSAGSVVHVTPLSTSQASILRACQVPPPATVTALHPT
jgi:hypothetical protein